MRKSLTLGLALAGFALMVRAAAGPVGVVSGTVQKIDAGAKTVVVKTASGAEETFHLARRTVVHGAEAATDGSKDALHSLKEGSEVAVHYTVEGTEKTAGEIDNIGEGGLQKAEGTFASIDRGAKTLTVKTADGTQETYHLADHAARDTGKNISAGAQKARHITVYYTEEAGQKVAHFFQGVF